MSRGDGSGRRQWRGRLHVSFRWRDPSVEPNWFDLDGDRGLPSSAADVAFLRALRERAMTREWDCDSEETFGFHAPHGDGLILVVGLSFTDYETSKALMTFALTFNGNRVFGDRVHDQTYEFTGRTEAAFEYSGPGEQLADRAAEWFEELLTWPIERREWYEGDRQVYREWMLSRTGRKLWVNGPQSPDAAPDKVFHVRGARGGRA